ncbi:BLOC-1-related complex subunit 5 [Lingula anatina]|uniref:BLOC-1-related complex subunit 5 n=1 Tax=Lingula anatina TaxID=7574 RepID=A0A1S3H013_LINAN|nr:BLOC-1-related complex subunit 5 [Lingula anatina]|eukprot:XP_013379465.1 BLOC-1-related complex subunit 5 [Lingula anatina]
MGGEQSSPVSGPAGSQLKSQRDEDIPYTSYSISKPIDDAPKQSPKLRSKSAGSAESTEGGGTAATSGGGSGGGGPKHDIVVVAEGVSQKPGIDPELIKLQTIPMFLPVIRGSLNIPNIKETELGDKLDYGPVLELCLRYQEHLKQCAEAVAFDQNALSVRIKEIDFAIRTIMGIVTERQKKYAKYAEQLQKVHEMTTTLTRIKSSVEYTLSQMEQLNKLLPPEEQLEPFTISPSHSVN